MALLMVIIYIGLFLECFYFILDVICTEFTYTPIFLPDYIRYEGLFGSPFIFILFKFHMFKRGYFWINFDVLRRNFVILRISGWNIIGMYYLNACVVSSFSFLVYMARRWCGVQTHHMCTTYLSFCLSWFHVLQHFCALSSADTSQESCLGTVVNRAIFYANQALLEILLPLMPRETGMYDLPEFQNSFRF